MIGTEEVTERERWMNEQVCEKNEWASEKERKLLTLRQVKEVKKYRVTVSRVRELE